jgi:fluoride ion exporter CrcB/FEX
MNIVMISQKYPAATMIVVILASMLAGLVVQLRKGRTWNREHGYFVQWKTGTLIPRVLSVSQMG